MIFFHVTQIIEHLRQNLPTWSIDGAAEQAVAEDSSRLPLPAMYVGLGEFKIIETTEEIYLQKFVSNFFIIVCTPTTSNQDRTGKYAQDFVPHARNLLLSLLVNEKKFEPDSHAIMYVGDVFEKLDKARYYHRYNFSITGLLDPADVVPLELDYFDKLFVDYEVEGFTADTPPIQQEIKPLYFTTD